MADWIFLDHHTKTKPSKAIAEQMMRDEAAHWITGPTKRARNELLELFDASESMFHLMGSGAEANFQVLFSHYMDQIRETGRTHILSMESEGKEILGAIKRLEKFEVQGKILPVNENGHLTKEVFSGAVRARSSLLSLSLAHPLTGVVQPIHDLIEVCKENEIRVHVDLSAAIGKLYLPLEGIDFLTFDGRLLHCPGQIGGLIVKKGVPFTRAGFGGEEAPYSYFAALKSAVEKTHERIDTYAMEVGRLRGLFEKKLGELGAHLFFQDVERLPNMVVAAFEGVHGEALLEALKKQGVFATTGNGELARVLGACGIEPHFAACGVSFALSDETTQEEVERAAETLSELLEKLKKRPRLFTEEEAKAKDMRLCHAKVGEGTTLELSLLVDEEDGVIADAKADVFGPPVFARGAEAACDLLVRKNYIQARRLSAELIEKEMGESDGVIGYLNPILEAIDQATERCMDIPIEDVYVAPPSMEGGERQEYPGWETLNNQQRKSVIDQVMETDIQPYVELDAGGVEVVKVEENRVTIAYSGNCTSCFSATGATLDAIGNILRHKIYPDLMVVPDLSLLGSH